MMQPEKGVIGGPGRSADARTIVPHGTIGSEIAREMLSLT